METLGAYVMRQGAFSELDAVGWTIRLAKCIEAIHAKGRTHGKVSAECISIEDSAATSKAALVEAHTLTDNVPLQSPERLAGAPPCAADDTWAVAVTLYLALTGRLPFHASPDGRVRHDERPARLWEFQEKSDVLQSILDRAFEADFSKRTRTVEALRVALEGCFEFSALPPLEEEDEHGPVPASVEGAAPSRAVPDPAASLEAATEEQTEEQRIAPAPVVETPVGNAKRSRLRPLLVALAVAGGASATFIALRSPARRDDSSAQQGQPSSTAPNEVPSVAPPATAEASSPSPGPPRVADVNACMRPLFANNTFGHGVDVDFSFVCTETDPRRGSIRVVNEIVRSAANKVISDGMREWGMLGWHDMAAFAVMRAHCCPSALPLSLPPSTAACPSLAKVLNALAATFVSAVRIEDPSLQEAAREYTRTVRCLVKNDGTRYFKRHTPPQDGEAALFQKTLMRIIGG